MKGLTIKINPMERFIINGAVVENGKRRTVLCIKTPKTNLLRMKDAIHPEDASTPVKRACYIAQLALSNDLCPEVAHDEIANSIDMLKSAFDELDVKNDLGVALSAVSDHNFYLTLKHLKALIALERHLLKDF